MLRCRRAARTPSEYRPVRRLWLPRAILSRQPGQIAVLLPYFFPQWIMSLASMRRLSLACLLAAPLCSLPVLLSAQSAMHSAIPVPARALDPANIDRKYAACNDFYMFANGGWIARNPIPPAFASWGSFAELTERNNLVLKTVLDSAASQARTTTDPNTKKLGTFYSSCMDSTAAETAGIAPLSPELARIAAVSDRAQLEPEIARLHVAGFGGAFRFGGGADAKNASMVIAHASQGGITLPDRDYYLRNDAATQAIRSRYTDYVTQLFTLAGDAPAVAAANAQRVLSIETSLARASLPRVALRDPNATYHPMTLAQANALTPAFDWTQYVKVVFTPAAKAKMLAMVMNLRSVLRDRITHADWMSEATRKQALEKMDAFNQKIGYPDTWRDYSALNITPGVFINNVTATRAYETRRDLAMIGKPVDRTRWGMTPPTVNAYYSPPLNEIVFPAGRIQPPFFALSYDDAANYGGVGGTIGHEMSHGFDDQGRQYDARGNLRDWWTPEDARRYTAKAAVVENQYNGYVAIDTLHVNGKLTLGENLADVVGVSVAFDAMERALRGQQHHLIDGFTPEQRFFLAYAQARLTETRPERARVAVATDPHSPGPFRVNGPLANMPEFAQAFGCKPGDAMVRPDSIRAHIW